MRHNSLSSLTLSLRSEASATSLHHPATTQAESFPLQVYPCAMYPPHVSDHDIQHVIHELTDGNQLPSGAHLRSVLQARFGSRGGVARIYRLLSKARTATSPSIRSPVGLGPIDALERELQTLRKSIKLADYREQVHQSRWATEVDHLRQQVATLEPLALQAKAALDNAELLRRQLHAAHMRIAVLEEQLMEKLRAEGEGTAPHQ